MVGAETDRVREWKKLSSQYHSGGEEGSVRAFHEWPWRALVLSVACGWKEPQGRNVEWGPSVNGTNEKKMRRLGVGH